MTRVQYFSDRYDEGLFLGDRYDEGLIFLADMTRVYFFKIYCRYNAGLVFYIYDVGLSLQMYMTWVQVFL